MKASDFLTKEQQQAIVEAIAEAEKQTSGEIRVHLEMSCNEDVLDRAVKVFEKLGMHKTRERNGVLIYIAIRNREFAIIGDAGINAKVPPGFWEETKNTMISYFKEEKYAEGIIHGIRSAGEHLKKYFPYCQDDVNELSDEISFGS